MIKSKTLYTLVEYIMSLDKIEIITLQYKVLSYFL